MMHSMSRCPSNAKICRDEMGDVRLEDMLRGGYWGVAAYPGEADTLFTKPEAVAALENAAFQAEPLCVSLSLSLSLSLHLNVYIIYIYIYIYVLHVPPPVDGGLPELTGGWAGRL